MNFKRNKSPQIVPYNPEAFDVNTLEDDIADAMHHSIQERQQYAATPLPPPTIAEIGQVTAEAVMSQYDAAAKTIEDMKPRVKEWADAHERALEDLKAMLQHIDETATRYREMGKETHDRLQRSSAILTEVRELCDAITAKINPPA